MRKLNKLLVTQVVESHNCIGRYYCRHVTPHLSSYFPFSFILYVGFVHDQNKHTFKNDKMDNHNTNTLHQNDEDMQGGKRLNNEIRSEAKGVEPPKDGAIMMKELETTLERVLK